MQYLFSTTGQKIAEKAGLLYLHTCSFCSGSFCNWSRKSRQMMPLTAVWRNNASMGAHWSAFCSRSGIIIPVKLWSKFPPKISFWSKICLVVSLGCVVHSLDFLSLFVDWWKGDVANAVVIFIFLIQFWFFSFAKIFGVDIFVIGLSIALIYGGFLLHTLFWELDLCYCRLEFVRITSFARIRRPSSYRSSMKYVVSGSIVKSCCSPSN